MEDLFDTLEIKTALQRANQVLYMTIEIIQNSNASNNQADFMNLNEICSNKSLVIYLPLQTEEKFMLYWKSSDDQNFFVFKPINNIPEESLKCFGEFIANFLLQSLKQGHNGELF